MKYTALQDGWKIRLLYHHKTSRTKFCGNCKDNVPILKVFV